MSKLSLMVLGSILLGVAAGLAADSVAVGTIAGGGCIAFGMAFLEDPS